MPHKVLAEVQCGRTTPLPRRDGAPATPGGTREFPTLHHGLVSERRHMFVHIKPKDQKPKLCQARPQGESTTTNPWSPQRRDTLREEPGPTLLGKSPGLSVRRLPSGLLNFSPKCPPSCRDWPHHPQLVWGHPWSSCPQTQHVFPEMSALKTKRLAFYSFISPVP